MAEEAETTKDRAEERRSQEALEVEVARRTRALQAALDQKTALLQELDHRVKNNLQVVASLVLLKSRRVKDPQARSVLTNMAERIGALSTAHRLLYADAGATWFDLREFVTDLSRDLMVPLNPADIELSLDLDPVVVAGGKAAPLALLVNELVGNALRHAFPNGRGRVSVAAKRDGDLRIVVEDNGVGLASHATSDESFGKTLIDMLTRQLKGTMAWEDAAPGTRAVVVIPLANGEVRPGVNASPDAPS
jgi:two-component sensor histidine kinase